MKAISSAERRTRKPAVPLLENGDHLSQPEFHRRYEQYPEDVKFELIGGIVFMSSPMRRPHGSHHVQLSGVFNWYQAETPGVEALADATIILGNESEPQP